MNFISLRSIARTLFLLFLLQGCAGTYSLVEFEVLEPATVSFPENVRQLVFLNRAPISMDTWSEQNQVGMDPMQLVILDTLIVNNLNRGVLEVLQKSPVESFRWPIWLSDRRRDTSYLEDKVLTKKEVMEICGQFGGDAIVSLEFYSTAIDLHFDYYNNTSDDILNEYYEVSNKVIWKIYLPGNVRPFDSYSTVDTLYYPVIQDGTLLSDTPGLEMIREIYFMSGHNYGSYLVPVWNRTSRVLYRGKEDSLKVAAESTDKGDWENAYSIWRDLTHSEDSIVVAKAFHNMAVYYELEDQLDSASLMLDLSLASDTLEAGQSYRDELDVRLLNRKEIEEQVK